MLLKFNQKDGNFTEGKEYSYFNDTESFTINYNCEKLSDRITTTIYYVEMNAVLFKAEIKNEDGSGNILIPKDFKGSASFERTDSDDLISAKSFNVLTGEELKVGDLEEMWLQIQNLTKVRVYMDANPDQQVNVFSNHPTSNKHLDTREWIFVIKN